MPRSENPNVMKKDIAFFHAGLSMVVRYGAKLGVDASLIAQLNARLANLGLEVRPVVMPDQAVTMPGSKTIDQVMAAAAPIIGRGKR